MQQATTQTFSASKVKNSFGAIISKVQKGEYGKVIVENHGEPVAAIIDMKELGIVEELKEKERRREALARVRAIREEVQANLKEKLSEKEAMEIADRFSHELIEDMAKEGKIKFERDFK